MLSRLTALATGASADDAHVTAHVDFVGVLFLVWGGLTTLVGLSTLMLGVGAAALASSTRAADGQLAAGLAAGALFVVAIIAILWGIAHIVVGPPIRRHQSWARLAALMLGTVDLLLFPFGTALGGYALWALLGERRRALFDEP